ncbi:MucB/RseB C-terminal domain-containing protein [Pseudidiomarina sp.]|uniref:MucB/RseB C-terminal domain-containing protein n=1 Tax=Pseudidiomarina sp. TaxID=2081707 RepID=UPI003A98031A
MTTNFWSGSLIGLLLTLSTPIFAQQTSPANLPAAPTTVSAAEQRFNEMSQALRELNFEATLVRVSGDRLEPMQWLHGTFADGLEAELIVMLNGPDRRIVRLGQETSYYSQLVEQSYSLTTDVTYGLLPAAFYQDFAALKPHYQVSAADRGVRVVGRETKFVRVLSRDNDRYHYGLWIDNDSGMLLKMQMTTPQGEILEQLQVTHFYETETVPISLSDVRGVQRPPRLLDSRNRQAPQFGAQPQWLPDGFTLQRSNHRLLAQTRLATDHFLYSDGLTEFSLYVAEGDVQSLPNLGVQGPESIYNVQLQGLAVTAVGKLPLSTLQRIADSVVLSTESTE